MATSFVENVNLLASKVDIVEEANSLFDEGVIPILEEIALLDLDEAILDLKKGNYLGNRKIDINLALNIQGITQDLIDKDPDKAEAIWTNPSNTVLYNKATATFVDGTVIELPFLFDGNPVTISTHGDLLAQLSRLDYVYAQAQIDSLYQVTVGDNTDYTITIDNDAYTYTSGVGATRENIIAGIANMINAEAIPITANVTDLGTKLTLTANIAGNPFYVEVGSNMAITTITPNIIEGPRETEFLAKLTGTLAANFASPVVGEIVKLYDIIGQNSNLERLQLHAISGKYIEEAPLYYWAKTTSAFQTLSMRANDIIKLGNEIDKIIKLATSIDEVIEVRNHLPQLVDTYDVNGNPNGDQTIYNALTELIELHSKLTEIITVYNDMKVGGNNYIQSVVNDLKTANTIGVVAEDLNLGVNSTVKNVGNNITSVVTVSDNITSVNTVDTNISDVNLLSTNILGINTVADSILDVNTVSDNIGKVNNVNDNIVPIIEVADSIVPNLTEILQADTNAALAVTKAREAANSALLAAQKSNEIKNVSVGSTITGAPGTNASVVYNPATGKFTFVVPQGIKGDRGEAFVVNAVGPASNQSLYDSMQSGFSFLAVDTGMIYFKASGSVGDWTIGSPFGKGDKGDPGEDGNSIVQITFESSDHTSNLPTQPGCIDTYKAVFSDGSFNTFTVYNGKDSDLNNDNVATLTNKTINDFSNIIGANHVHILVENNSGSMIVKGTPVRKAAIQSNPNYLCIEPCTDNSNFAIGIAYENIEGTAGTLGRIITTGSVTHTNTEIWEVGDTLYIGTNGSLTNNKPSTPAYQICGVVQVKSVTEGVILVNMNDIYNNSSVNLQGNQTISDVKTFTSTIVGNISGSAGTATKLQTARNIAGTPFDGTTNINILFANISDTPTSLGGYNITDAYTAAEIGTMAEFTANLN